MYHFFAETEGTANNTPSWTSIVLIIAVVVLLIVVVVVLPMINNRKQQKQYANLLESVRLGATIKTIGGMIGKVVSMRTVGDSERVITIETGEGDTKTTMEFDINAVYQVIDPVTYKPVPTEPVKKEKKADKPEEKPVEKPAEAPADVDETPEEKPEEHANDGSEQ